MYLPRIGLRAALAAARPCSPGSPGRRGARGCRSPRACPFSFSLAGFVLPWPVHADPDAPSVRLMSYNVEHRVCGRRRRSSSRSIGYSPDVLFFVEHGSNTIIEPLQKRYPSVRVSGQFVIATRLPGDVDVRSREAALLGEAAIAALAPGGDRDAARPHRLLRGASAVAARRPQRGARARHAARDQGALGLSFASQDIVAHNSGLRVDAGRRFRRRGRAGETPGRHRRRHEPTRFQLRAAPLALRFHDAFTKARWGFGYTYPVGGRHPAWMRIDRIMASDELRFIHFEVGCGPASDHACVVADLQRAP